MLTHFFPTIKENRLVKTVCAFLYSDWYICAIVALMVLSNAFGLELPVYYVYTLACITTVLFAEDLYPIFPMACCGYMTFSATNNPATNAGNTIFSNVANIVQLAVLAVLIAIALLSRLVFELVNRKREKKLPALTFGFLALGASYILGGAFSPYYGGRTMLFGLVQIVALSALYFLFSVTVNWEKRGVGDCAKLFTAVGAGVLLEAVGLYALPSVRHTIANGTFDRGYLVTGWGIYNNVGGMLAMCIPAPFFLASTKKNGWVYTLLASVFLLGVVLTQSRNSILCGAIVYCACAVIALVKSEKRERKLHAIVLGAIAVCGIVVAIVFFGKIVEVFGTMLNQGFLTNGRDEIYGNGLKQFADYPIFGNGFYECTAFQAGGNKLPADSFLPPRYHNTVVQLLASGGVVAMGAYLFHRVQTALLFFKRPSLEKTFIGLCILVLLVTSLFDCHFFNFGPGLLYSILLVMAERACADGKSKEGGEVTLVVGE